MFKSIYINSLHCKNHRKLATSWGVPQENDAKFRFAIHPQGIRQLPNGQTVATLEAVYKDRQKHIYSNLNLIKARLVL